MKPADYFAWVMTYGYLTLAVTGGVTYALSRRFPEQKWLATVAKVCTTVAMHWGVISSIARSPAPKPGESGPDIAQQIRDSQVGDK